MKHLRRTLPVLGLLLSLAVMSVAPLRSSAEPAGPAPQPQVQTADVRYGPISISVADLFAGSAPKRLVQSQLIVDESWAIASRGGGR